MPSKTATVFVIDVRMEMSADCLSSNASNKPLTCREVACQLVARQLQDLIINGRKGDVVSLIIVGSESADNPLAVDDQYQHVSIYNYCHEQLFCMASVDMFKFVSNGCVVGGDYGDVMDGIIVGMHVLELHCKQLQFDRRMFVCAHAGGSLESDGYEQVLHTATVMNLDFIMVGFNFPDPVSISNPHLANATFWRNFTCQIPSCTRSQPNRVLDPEEASVVLDQLRHHLTLSAPVYCGDLTFGTKEDLVIPVTCYLKTSGVKIPTSKKFSMLAEEIDSELRAQYGMDYGAVKLTKTYKYVDGNDKDSDDASESDSVDASHIHPENVIRAYRYGKAVIPFSIQDEEAAQLLTKKSIKIIGFIKSDAIPRHYYISGTMAIVPNKDVRGTDIQFTALLQAMTKANIVAIARYCRINNAKPKFGVLISTKKGYGLFIQIPYADDFRFVVAPPIDDLTLATLPKTIQSISTESKTDMLVSIETEEQHNKEKDDSSTTISHHDISDTSSTGQIRYAQEHARYREKFLARKVSPQQAFDAVDSLIDAMDISVKSAGTSFNPKHVSNPLYQRLCDCIAYRAIHPNSTDILPVNPTIKRNMEPRQELVEKAMPAIDQLRQAFTIKKVVDVEKPKKSKHVWADLAREMVKSENAEPTVRDHPADDTVASESTKASSYIGQPLSLSTHPATVKHITQRAVDTISTLDPVSEFQSMVSRSDGNYVEQAMTQMCHIVKTLIAESIGQAFYAKAFAALKALRVECVRHSNPSVYNALMRDLKTEVQSGLLSRDHGLVWKLIVDQGESLITQTESCVSLVSHREAVEFLQYPAQQPALVSRSARESNTEDLFAQMD
ncbi:hypothetical protein BATDEDRAFT_89512 [Batrachochytrium dendrobatidis JAM81]|uniref:Ku domain-containing protein n=1 Tax=Batrachochytrium dendrobatidis (strain JAM81 / FGSC 10211) TaxID=684364 RepID=F4P5J4_BATDJ|nr:uncharacterized protein BATDEDRAFT_89512 [Batrachochytrium dendrobatidis JAM81]EGF79428.1 hypothetical protein BATDEDRAFT_89512 [Batrachochytrium dendrobatidis JAM81]KAK5666044.1 ATP-dependent DNA helicase yku80 [Batrachochytrium dendrobatidis]|eukprot:XP_006680151.1 hypothetical protein BATDEDRAFT_89512 [Batrachochytrium dendrobatidis JAM81]